MRETREQCAATTQSLLCQLRYFRELNVNSNSNASTSSSSTQQLLPPLLCRNPHPRGLLTYSWLSHWEKKEIWAQPALSREPPSPGAMTSSHRHKTAPCPSVAFLREQGSHRDIAIPTPKDLHLNTKTLFLPGALVKQPSKAARFPSGAGQAAIAHSCSQGRTGPAPHQGTPVVHLMDQRQKETMALSWWVFSPLLLFQISPTAHIGGFFFFRRESSRCGGGSAQENKPDLSLLGQHRSTTTTPYDPQLGQQIWICFVDIQYCSEIRKEK